MNAPTDQQLVQLVRHLARMHLEIERGVRSPHQLTNLMSPQAERLWLRTHLNGRRLPGGPVRTRDLGTPRIQRITPQQAYASITTPTQPGRWGALTFDLRLGPSIRITKAQRLHAGLDYGRPQPDLRHPRNRLAFAQADRRLVASAIDVEQRAMTGAEPFARWQDLLSDLDREIAGLVNSRR